MGLVGFEWIRVHIRGHKGEVHTEFMQAFYTVFRLGSRHNIHIKRRIWDALPFRSSWLVLGTWCIKLIFRLFILAFTTALWVVWVPSVEDHALILGVDHLDFDANETYWNLYSQDQMFFRTNVFCWIDSSFWGLEGHHTYLWYFFHEEVLVSGRLFARRNFSAVSVESLYGWIWMAGSERPFLFLSCEGDHQLIDEFIEQPGISACILSGLYLVLI